MSQSKERDYVLGTHDEELERLGVQHRAWRPVVLDCWKKAGITAGSRVLDVGAGPGYATVDLAERWSGNFSRVRSLHDLAFFPAADEFGRLPSSRDRHLAGIGRRSRRRAAIAVVVNEERICGALGCAANFLSSTKRLYVAMA